MWLGKVLLSKIKTWYDSLLLWRMNLIWNLFKTIFSKYLDSNTAVLFWDTKNKHNTNQPDKKDIKRIIWASVRLPYNNLSFFELKHV